MGAILGTVRGWEKDSRWTSGYRIYYGPAYIKYVVPPERISPEKRHEYRVRVNITVYLCDSLDLTRPIVIREIKGILLVEVSEEEYSGGLEQWVSDVSIREAEELLSRSNVEVAGLVPCDKGYDVKAYDESYTPPEIIYVQPPIPKYIIDEIELLETMIEEAETDAERKALEEELTKLKSRYGIK